MHVVLKRWSLDVTCNSVTVFKTSEDMLISLDSSCEYKSEKLVCPHKDGLMKTELS